MSKPTEETEETVTVSFKQKEEEVSWYKCTCEVPESICEEGKEAVEQYIKENGQEANLTYEGSDCTETRESFLEVDSIYIP
jgi:hypothetical protein